jgi:hypothetical protein
MSLLAIAAAGGLLAPAASAATSQYSVSIVGKYGGEPYIVSDGQGVLYDSSPSLGAQAFRSLDLGRTWAQTAIADPSSGDTALGTDQSNALYLGNLGGSVSAAPLQGDVFKSVDRGKTFKYGQPFALGGSTCGTSCSPFGVDRQWVDGYIAPGQTTDSAEVVFMYHDFYGPSQIWVNISTDGGKTFGAQKDILANLNPAGAVGGAVALADSACNTVPVGLQIAKGGPHPGRIFAAWIAADPTSLGSGCNISMVQAFHNLIVAWSDDGGSTWTPQVAFDGGVLHDASSPFAGFALDSQGNPYFGFTMNLNSDPTCDGPTNPQTANCEFDTYVVWSPDGGATWKGGSGTVPGSAGTPYKVNSDQGTHFFPWIAAGAPGHVVVTYLRTPQIIATGPNGKEIPGSCYPVGACTFTGAWNLWAGQTADLATGDPSTVRFATGQITSTPMHVGDICNLGIACVPSVSNRNLLDFISVAIDPVGCAHIAFADDNKINKLLVANEIAGCFTTAGSGPGAAPTPAPAASTPMPNSSSAAPGPLAGAVASLALGLFGFRLRSRRRRDSRPTTGAPSP